MHRAMTNARRQLAEAGERLKALRTLVETFADWSTSPGVLANVTHYETLAGSFSARALLNGPGISVANLHLTPGTEMPGCHHPFKEWLIVHEGSLHVDSEDGVFDLFPGDSVVVHKEVRHCISTDMGAAIVAVAWPGTSDYPH